MQAAEILDEPAPIGEAEYQTLEQTLLESDRGRRFLAEFIKRNKTPETTEILGAIQRLEKTMTRQRKVPDLDRIRLDIAEMHDAIERTKNEIANIKAEGADSNRFVDASHELDAIVTQTEGATQTILEAAEQIQEHAWTLRENGAAESVCDEIDAKATEIFMACSFQDLTGQRTTKVVQVLRYLESRINLMINIWGIEEQEADTDAGPVDTRPDAHLLNGPQHEGKGVSQSSVDDMFSNDAEADDSDSASAADVMDFDRIEPQADTEEAAETVADERDIDAIMAGDSDGDAGSEEMDVSDIDAMFNTPAEETGAEEAGQDAEDENALETLDESAIDKLFDAEMAEVNADTEWEQTEEQASDANDADDPLQQLTEAERQALFN